MPSEAIPALLSFHENYFERIWGGRALDEIFGKALPADVAIGEAWLVADHATCESVVRGGTHDGRTLRELVNRSEGALLGTHAQLTPYGRFPLLLKLLDARDVLSVQVHPNDALAAKLGEPDVGKTEMWHVLRADAGATLYCGLEPGVDRDTFARSITEAHLESCLATIEASPGMSVYVPAGTVHAIGGGLLLAEIQQNSNITYRCYDWGRVDAAGKPRELHVEQSLAVTRFGERPPEAVQPLAREDGSAHIETHAACRYFAAERIRFENDYTRDTCGKSFHLILALEGRVQVHAMGDRVSLKPGETVLVSGWVKEFLLEGAGIVMDYFVPDREVDIVRPLEAAGHSHQAIARTLLDRWLP